MTEWKYKEHEVWDRVLVMKQSDVGGKNEKEIDWVMRVTADERLGRLKAENADLKKQLKEWEDGKKGVW